MTITPKPGVSKITPFSGVNTEARQEAGKRIFKLAANESPLGPSPKAIEAFQAAQQELHLYPRDNIQTLRESLARSHGIPAERIVCGNGSEELITLLANSYLRPGDEVLFSEHAFFIYRIAAFANSATPVEAPERERTVDVDAMLAKVSARTRLVYLANPGNPTGTYLPASELRRLHAGLPPDVLLVIDSAYAEYVGRKDYEPGIELVGAADNVVMTRTFSKAYGLAGLRVGWAYCPPHVAEALDRVRTAYNVNVAAQKAAMAALEDRAFLDAAVRFNETWRDWLSQRIRETGILVDSSAGNFLLIRFSNAQQAADANNFLIARGFMLQPAALYGLPNCLRLTIGSEEANRLVAQVLADFMDGQRR
jgi:histidinol-phosphate aminotransferase